MQGLEGLICNNTYRFSSKENEFITSTGMKELSRIAREPNDLSLEQLYEINLGLSSKHLERRIAI